MLGQAQAIRSETELLGDGPPITIPAFAQGRRSVRHFFGTKAQAGDPAMSQPPGARAPRRRPLTVVSVQQVHGTDVLVLDRPVQPGESFDGGWDALVTNQPGLLLTVRTADCVPVLLYDPRRRVVAAIHAGWRGAVAGIVRITIETLARRFGSSPSSLEIGVGPSAGACCYEVDEPVFARLPEALEDWRAVVTETGPSTAMLDLHGLVRRQAAAAGVPADRIRAVRVCTVCYPTLFYSYRRDGGVKGTMVSGILLRPGA